MAKYPRNVKQAKELELKRIQRKLSKLQDAVYALGLVELPAPLFKGWKRCFGLRADILNRKDAKDIKEILEKINMYVYSRKKDFSEYDFDEPALFRAKQRLKGLSVKEWQALNPHQKTFFYKWKDPDFRKSNVRYYFTPDYFFVHKVKRHYITHVPILDSELESQIAEIENKIQVEHLWPKIYKYMGWEWGDRDWDVPIMKIREKLLDEAIQRFHKEEE